MLSTYTLSDGSFTLNIPIDLVDNDNVIRINYFEVENTSDERYFWGYEESDIILSKEEFSSVHEIEAYPEIMLTGGIGLYMEVRKPMVLDNGLEINYKDFVKFQMSEDSPFSNHEKKELFYFSPKFAQAIGGERAKDGLYIFIDRKTE